MPFYTGSSADGSDMQEFQGMYINPENPNEWSSTHYTASAIKDPELRKKVRDAEMWKEVVEYCNAKFTFNDVYNQIQNKTCPLSSRLRQYVLSRYDENENFK